jgi:hypothetical protein
MGFLAPAFLGALGLLALPVWLHLLKRHRLQTVSFSSLMFFERSIESSVRQRRLDYLALLACRMALLALIVFAFARPFVRTAAPVVAGAPGVALAILDDSASMRFGGRFEKAKQEAISLAGEKARTGTAAVATFASQFSVAVPPTQDGARLVEGIRSLKATDGRSSFGELARGIRAFAQGQKQPVEAHLFSDLQRSSMPAAFAELQLGAGMRLVLHPLGSKEEPNWAVESVAAPKRVSDPAKAKIEAVVAGFNTPESTRTAVLMVNGREAARKPVTIPANGRARVEFSGLNAAYGFSRCEVALTPADGLADDDRYLFAVERSDPRTVLVVSEPRAQRAGLFLTSALEAASPGLWRVEHSSLGAMTAESLGKSAFAVLADPGPLSQWSESTLKRHVESGGGLLIALGPATIASGRVPLTAEIIRGSRYASRGGDRFLPVGNVDESSPMLAKAARWEGVRFYQAADVLLKQSRPLAKLSDGAPLLMESILGDGRILILGSGLDNLTNDFPSHPAFVPFVEQAAFWLSGYESGSLQSVVDAAIELRQRGATAMAAEVLDPEGNRALSLSAAAQAKTVSLDRRGFWEVRRGRGRNQMVAVNIDRRESDLTPMPAESAELWQGGPQQQQGPGAEAGAAAPEENRKPLWPLAIAAAFIAAAVEVLMASRTLTRETA